MMNRLENKRDLIQKYGVLNLSEEAQRDLALVENNFYNISFFRKMINKFNLLIEDRLREKNM